MCWFQKNNSWFAHCYCFPFSIVWLIVSTDFLNRVSTSFVSHSNPKNQESGLPNNFLHTKVMPVASSSCVFKCILVPHFHCACPFFPALSLFRAGSKLECEVDTANKSFKLPLHLSCREMRRRWIWFKLKLCILQKDFIHISLHKA